MVLTATRSGEARGATWAEIDLDAKVWTVPASRMKAKVLHKVPLSVRAMEVLAEAKNLHNSVLVFLAPRSGKTLNKNYLSTKLLPKAGVNATAHGFRTSFRVWAEELSGTSHATMERALAHVVKNTTEATYNRTCLLDQRRQLMQDWANYIGG